MTSRTLFAAVPAVLLAAGLLPLSAAGAPNPLPALIDSEMRVSGEVRLSGRVDVAEKGILILEKGAVVVADPGAVLAVAGVLEARGTTEKPVTLKGTGTEPWGGVEATGTTRLSHALVTGARTGILAKGGKLSLSDCRLERNGQGIHLLQETSASIERCRFSGNDVGIRSEMKAGGPITGCAFAGDRVGVAIGSGSVHAISRNRFEGQEMGISIHLGFSGRIEGNIFLRDKVGVYLYQNGGDTVIVRNLFRDCADAGVLANSFSSPTVSNNRFEGGKAGVLAHQFSVPRVTRNSFSGLAEALHLEKKAQSEVSENVFARNETAVFLDFSSYPRLRDNLFDQNRLHLKLGRYQSSHWEEAAGSSSLVKLGASSQGSKNPRLGEMPTEFPSGVDASGNGWDAATLREMESKGPEGEISTLSDGRDTPLVTYDGFPGEYRLDRIAFAPWKKEKPANAGLAGWSGKESELGL